MTFIEAEKGRDVRENCIACSSHSRNADESYGNIYAVKGRLIGGIRVWTGKTPNGTIKQRFIREGEIYIGVDQKLVWK